MFFLSSIGFSQKVTNKGKEFYVSFYKSFGVPEDIILITSTVNTTGVITNPNSTYSQAFTVTAGNVTQITVPLSESYNTNPGLNNLGLIITAADSIGVYALSSLPYSSDATTVIPKAALGTEYLIASYNNVNQLHPSCFLIEATENNTTVQITTSVHANGNLSGVPFTVTLNKGQTYYVTADNIGFDPDDDISGSFVSVINGCNPIAVFAGVEQAQVTWLLESADIFYEQLFPINSFGKQFITSTIRGRNAYVGRVYAAYDSTKVFIDGSLSATLNRGKLYEFVSPQNTPRYITTSKPAEVMMFAPSQAYDQVFGPPNQGDPTMMTVPPLEQQLKQSVFLSPQMGAISAHKVSIVCKTVDAFNTVLDGSNVGVSFTSVPGNPLYSYAAFDISAGQHTITNNRGFISYAYGFGNSQGYGYCTGSSVENISTYFTCNQIPSIAHPVVDVCTGVDTFKIVTSDSNTHYKWDFGDGAIINTDGTVLIQTHNYTIPGTYLVTLINTKGTINTCSILNSDTSFLTVKVNAALVPSVKISSTPANPVCQGSINVNFIATPVNEGVTPVYQWKRNGIVVGGNTQILTLPSVAANDQIICTLTSSITCATIPTVADTMNIQLLAPSAPTLTIIASADTVCDGSTVYFTSVLGSNYQNVMYQWMRNGNNTGFNQDTYSCIPVNGDIITCVITVNSYCTSPNTGTSNAKTITVLPATNVSEVQINASQNPVCANTGVTFTATPTLGGATPSYQWKLNSVNVGLNSATLVLPTMQNGDKVDCIMTSSSPVVCNRTAYSNTITMQITPALTPSVNITASRNNICPGDLVNFTAVPVNGGTTPIYQWKINTLNAGTNSSTFSTSTLSNNDVVSCTMLSNVACVSVAGFVSSNTITMIVSSTAAPAISVTASKTNICQSDAVTFTAIPLNSNPTTTYQWKLNGINVGTNSTSYNTTTLQNNDTVYCIMNTISACSVTPFVQSNKILIQVNPVVTPSINIIASKTNICEGDLVSFTASALNGGSTPTYQWKVNGIIVGTNSVSYSSATFNNNDLVTCSLTTSLPCPSIPGPVVSASIKMTVNPIVSSTISINVSKNPICKGDNAEITTVITNGGSNPVYKWLLNGIPLNNNSNTYNSVNFADGDKISCNLISSISCSLAAGTTDIIMKVNPAPTVSFNPVQVILPYGNTYQMQPITTGSISKYLWSPSIYLNNNLIFQPVTNTTQNQKYTLKVTNSNDCSATADITIVVFKDFKMPNSFVPAGFNKLFKIPSLYQSIKIHYFKIFNRYGQQIFETTDVAKGWDGTINGKAQPGGAYVWIVEYEHPITKVTTLAQGSAILIR